MFSKLFENARIGLESLKKYAHTQREKEKRQIKMYFVRGTAKSEEELALAESISASFILLFFLSNKIVVTHFDLVKCFASDKMEIACTIFSITYIVYRYKLNNTKRSQANEPKPRIEMESDFSINQYMRGSVRENEMQRRKHKSQR